MSRQTISAALLRGRCAAALAWSLAAPPGRASPIESPNSAVGSSDTAGRRPPRPRRTNFELDEPGPAGGRQERRPSNLPEGVFGNPGAIFKCRSADFALNHCPPGSQVGLVTIVANYEGDPNYLLGTAPVYNMETVSEDETARLAFVAPTVNIPINDPDHGPQRLATTACG